MAQHRVYLLSPARCSGKRAALLLRPGASFELARQVRTPAGAPLGAVFSFMSGLYFRGKLAYAQQFAQPPRGCAGVLVIVPGRGLVPADTAVTASDLQRMAEVAVDPADANYLEPLRRDAQALADQLAARPRSQAVLLGSIATGKYLEPLLAVLGQRLRFPEAFIGRGDMSRGGLMLRCVTAGKPLRYIAADGAQRHGTRPPRLTRVPKRSASTPR